MSDPVILTDRAGPTLTITLNRPDKMNAMSRDMVAALCDAVVAASSDDTLRAIVLTGAGRAFCGGVDLKEVAGSGDVGGAFTWHGAGSLFDTIKACPHPVISAVNGYAITGGLELALLGDFLIASEAAVFADTHARVGITPSWGLTQVLPRLIGINRARQMSLTGAFVDAQTALDWGLVNEVVAIDALVPRARSLAAQIAETDPLTLRRIRGLIAEGETLALPDALARERDVFEAHIAGVTPERLEQNRAAVVARGQRLASGQAD